MNDFMQARIELGGQSGGNRRRIHADVERVAQGLSANIRSLQWDGSEIQGTVLYHDSSPDSLAITIEGGTLDIRPWELNSEAAGPLLVLAEDATPFARAAAASSQLVGKILTVPKQLLSASPGASTTGKYFSEEPIDMSYLSGYEADISGHLGTILSVEGTAKKLKFDLALNQGKLNASTDVGFLNGGSVAAELMVDSALVVPTVEFIVSFKDVHRHPQQLDSPRTGFFSLHSRGVTQAELAANLNGLSYLELGKGPLDVGNTSLLTADMATGVFRTLIPGMAKKEPELRCAISLATFTDGIGITPYGYAARTDTANLMGKVEVDLGQEQILMQIRSRSRDGIGLSLNNAFSSTVNIKGPLSKPSIMPNTTGLLFRGWAAFMTAGMSVLGESMFNRTLASTNPCNEIRKAIRENLCKGAAPVSTSPIVCPQIE